jgi:2-C-methyl-D-erythritol 2,4-cyclodiphosphate synthase
MRVGFGFDMHRLVAGRRLVLGGLEIEHDRGLEGHSDADVVAHAVGDAILGALGEGDLGSHFPSSDPLWKDASGRDLLDRILRRVDVAGMRLENVDATVVAQEPRLAPVREGIRDALARCLSLEGSKVNIKLKSTDRLGAIGRGEGIAAYAVVLLTGDGE